MNRYRAALVHFGLSSVAVGTVFLVVYMFWYPGPLFRGAGGRELFLILALVDVTIGPLITLVIFKPGKRGLKFDLVVIAAMQVAALAYGTHVVFEARPVWMVFVKDRFDLIRANQVQEDGRVQAKPPFGELSLAGPRVVGARIPTDPGESLRIMISALAGADVSSYPQHYVAYKEVAADVAAKARPMTRLRELNAARVAEMDGVLAELARPESRIGFLPMRAGKRDLTVLVDAQTGEFLKVVDFKPWQY